jgi:hypothetical protein
MQRNILRTTRVAASAVLGVLALASACSGNDDAGSGDPTGETGGNGASSGTIAVAGNAGRSDGSGGTSSQAGESGTDGGVGSGTGGSFGAGGSLGTSGAASWCEGSCVCANGIDDDDDGLPDGLDPECMGPTDNDEGSFATGIPGDNRDPKWQDCFFDGNSGAGDDDCRYASECLTGEYESDHPDCVVTDACLEFCVQRTPSGCDCFGCCTVGTGDGTSIDVLTISTCSLDNIDDEDACPRCEKSTQCENECGECELCLGKTEADLPDSCHEEPPPPPEDGGTPTPPPPAYTCEDGTQVCSETIPCGAEEYCRLGCCTSTFVR